MHRRPILTAALCLGGTLLLSGFLSAAAYAQGSAPVKRIEVKFVDDIDIGVETGEPRDRSGQALGSQQALQLLGEIAISGGEWDRLVRTDEAKIDRMRAVAFANLGKRVGDLNNYFILRVPDGVDPGSWMNRLEALPEIAAARPAPVAYPSPLPDDFTDDQGYLDPATDGINAEWAWTLPGGTGGNVVIADLEYSWNLSHQDLPAAATILAAGETACDPFSDDNHGTAVLGEMVSLNNGFGTTGAAYDAGIRVVPVSYEDGSDCDYHPTTALTETIDALSAGDIILVEQQTGGPNDMNDGTQFGLVPMDWIESFYDAVVIAVGNGIHVVEAAGNGSQDLDGSEYDTGHAPFKPENDSGAIIVGGGVAPTSATDTDRSRRSSSCYGSRVNLQGWGHLVTTTGYGTSYSSEGKNLWYTDTFSGTSSASPIVTSAVALVESWHEQTQGGVMTPAAMRTLLVNTGSPQQSGTNPAGENIGPRPDILAAICTFDTGPPEITCPGDITVECSLNGAIWSGEDVFDAFFGGVSATDDVDPDPVIEHDAPVNFPLGTTTVTFTATDECGNQSTCTADVTVEDTTPPEVECPNDITVECSGFCGTPADDPQLTAFFAGFSTEDDCDPDPLVEDTAPDCFPMGTTTVTWTSTDSEGNSSQCSADVTVEDTTPPEITVSLNRTELWPPNHKYADITATVEVTDICDPDPTFILLSATSDEPDNGPADGNTVDDIVAGVGTDDVDLQLRSERQGTGDGRKYTLIYEASDASGNTAVDTACVTVPHDQGANGAAAMGFTGDGRDLEGVAGLFAVVVPSGQGFDPRQIDPARAQIGNHIAVVGPVDSDLTRVNGDEVLDLVLFYPVDPVIDLRRGSVEVVSAEDAVAASGSKLVEGAAASGTAAEQVVEVTPLSLHFVTAFGGNYRIEDIFALGAPVDFERRTKLPDAFAADPSALGGLLGELALHPFPNPVSGTRASVEVQVPADLAGAAVRLEIYDLAGRRVHEFGDRPAEAGVHRLDWNMLTSRGERAPRGVYFYRLRVGDRTLTKKFLIVGE
jgi:hypothetical protein